MGATAPNPLIAPQLRRLAERQGGHLTRQQLLRAGVTPDAIKHMLATGRLIRVHQGVYALGHRPAHVLARAHGALLACGELAALSHGCAAPLCAITARWPPRFELITPRPRRPNGLIIHRASGLLPVDFVVYQGLRATSPARTLLDIAPRLSDRQLLRAVNGQRIDHQLSLNSLSDVIERFPLHPGARRLRAILSGAPGEPFRSNWEIEWPPYARAHHFPPYEMNYMICGVRVDVFFIAERLIVELDGWETHRTRAAFEADRENRNEILAATGIPTVAITYRQFHDDGDRQARRLQAILSRRRRELALPGWAA